MSSNLCETCCCSKCLNTIWDGGLEDCFHCEFCIKGDGFKNDCNNIKH